MKTLLRMSLFFLILAVAAGRVNSQTVTVSVDSSKIVTTGKATEKSTAVKNSGDEIGQNQSKDSDSNGSKEMKKVRSKKPDMTKVRGARPPVIVRPGGVGIPKGVGKPTGIGNKGGR